ncbi:TMM81 protein, partial [Todus mexicanus]|nr:TMM81 protein [Todus mexicanus]
MKNLRNGRVLGILLCAFCLPLVASFRPVTIPPELKNVAAKVAVNATSCSVTCGLGVKVEEMCEVTPAGERRNCTLRRSSCVISWNCGLLHFNVPVGKPFQLSCLASDEGGVDSGACSYKWRFAPGLITTNNLLFIPFRNPEPVFRLSSTEESDAGTYRCDVQMLKTLRIIKRIYFGVRVIPNDLADLNFEKFLTWEQKLAADKLEGKAKNHTREEVQKQQHFKQEELLHAYLVGLGSGVIGGVLVTMALWASMKIWRR